MDTKRTKGGALQISHTVNEVSKRYLLLGDIHIDNPKCHEKLLKYDLDEALDTNAGILLGGDLMCVMQGKNDRRHSKSDLKTENKKSNYLDSVIETTAEFFRPYSDNILMICQGNHESAILNRLETDLTARLIEALNPKIHYGGYHGFVRFQFNVTETSRRGLTMYYHHGTPGGIISKGTPWVMRYAAMAPDADIVWSGDSHDRWDVMQPRLKLTQSGGKRVEDQLHIRTGTYKEEFDGEGGWATEKIVVPKSLGGVWLTFKNRWGEILPRATMT